MALLYTGPLLSRRNWDGQPRGNRRHLLRFRCLSCGGSDRFFIKRFQHARLRSLLKLIDHRYTRASAHLAQVVRRLGDSLHGISKPNMIFFRNKPSGAAVLDCFWDSAMSCRDNRQAGCHCFQYGIRYAFLILIWRRFARMQKKVRARVKLH